MRKTKVYSFLLAASFCLLCPALAPAAGLPASDPPESTQDKIQKDTIVAMLYPKIESAVNDYYQKYFIHLPHTAPYDIAVLSVDGEKSTPYNVNYSYFIVKVQVSPYLGAHNPVGDDQITFRIHMLGEVKIEKFEHIKSYALPWNLKDSAKGAWPPEE